jgi:hypothetical protein
LINVWAIDIDIKSLQNRLLKVCYVPATSTGFILLQPLRVRMKQKRQVVRAIKQSMLLRCLCLLKMLMFMVNVTEQKTFAWLEGAIGSLLTLHVNGFITFITSLD